MALKLVMMGTGDFALPTFLSLYDLPHKVVGLFTQPDRTGAGHHHHVNPLKQAALERGTSVFQPQKIKTSEALDQLRSVNADLCVVAAYGQILSAELLAIPRLGAINVHASVLPKYRGAAPIQYAILAGETETGVTIFQIEPKLDAGPILAIATLGIGANETAGALEQRLAQLAVPLVARVIDALAAGTATPIVQPAGEVTYAPRLQKSDGRIDWNRTAAEMCRHVRAMQPWPSPFTFLEQPGRAAQRLIVLEAHVAAGEQSSEAPPGTILSTAGGRILVQTGSGAVEILRLQVEGKRPLTAAESLRGQPIPPGARMTDGPSPP